MLVELHRIPYPSATLTLPIALSVGFVPLPIESGMTSQLAHYSPQPFLSQTKSHFTCDSDPTVPFTSRTRQEFRSKHRPVWAEVNLDNVAHNVQSLRAKLPKSSTLIAVVKVRTCHFDFLVHNSAFLTFAILSSFQADGYGHGAVQVGKAALEGGAQRLAVAVVEEGTLGELSPFLRLILKRPISDPFCHWIPLKFPRYID